MGLDVGTDRAPHALGVPDHEVGLLEDADDLRWAHERELAIRPRDGHGVCYDRHVATNHGLRRLALVRPRAVRAVAASAIHAIPADDAIRQLSEPRLGPSAGHPVAFDPLVPDPQYRDGDL